MVDYAKARSQDITFLAGDMRTFRLGRTFDVVLCFGSLLMYAVRNDDLNQTLRTFSAHCHPGSLLVLDMQNAAAFLGGGFISRLEGDVHSTAINAHYVTEHAIERRRQVLIRRRTWRFPDGSTVEDYCEYRMLFPQEMSHLLSQQGFSILGMYDNMELKETDFSGPTMYVASVFDPPDTASTG